MPTTRRSREIAAAAADLWEVVSDPHHLPRWWPRVARVEDVREDAFTQALRTARGKVVRADFRVASCDPAHRTLVWQQLVEDTPFARVLSAAETEIALVPADGAADRPPTKVTIELRQTLSRGAGAGRVARALIPDVGAMMVARAAARTLEEALDGLELIGG